MLRQATDTDRDRDRDRDIQQQTSDQNHRTSMNNRHVKSGNRYQIMTSDDDQGHITTDIDNRSGHVGSDDRWCPLSRLPDDIGYGRSSVSQRGVVRVSKIAYSISML